MWWTKISLLALVLGAVAGLNLDEPLESDELIDTINSAKTTWTAGRNFHPSATKKDVQSLLGWVKDKKVKPLPKYVPDYGHLDLPKNFDSRKKWSFCKALQTVRDQGACRSDWAVSSASVFTDRLCIATNGSWNGQLSAQQLVSCDTEAYQCGGGQPEAAFSYFMELGVVTGGDYRSQEGCQPYLIPNCEHHGTKGKYKPCGNHAKVAPPCQQKCYNKKYKTPFDKDNHKISASYLYEGVKNIQKEIYQNGPLVTCFDAYEDFLSYKSGVYKHKTGKLLGGHCVVFIGWGEENGTPYWLIKNVWNSDWGDNGLIKFLRGKDHCGIEEEVVGGIP